MKCNSALVRAFAGRMPDGFTLKEIREAHPGINAANLSSLLRAMTENGDLTRVTVLQTQPRRWVYKYLSSGIGDAGSCGRPEGELA